MTETAALTVPATVPQTDSPTPLELDAEWMASPERFFNRELSWLAFNQRVLEESVTRCWSGCGSCRSAPTTSTNSIWCAWPA